MCVAHPRRCELANRLAYIRGMQDMYISVHEITFIEVWMLFIFVHEHT